MRDEMKCLCGSVAKRVVEPTGLRILGRVVTIPDVPFFRCDRCGEKYFDLDSKIAEIAKKEWDRIQEEERQASIRSLTEAICDEDNGALRRLADA